MELGPRVVVVGTSGSGKTTLARRLARKLGVEHVELDLLNWRPLWTEAPLPEFRAAVAAATTAGAWVADGNYGKVRDLLWSRATHIVWLDRPFLLVFWRVMSRTIRRVVTREELFASNRERFRQSFLSRKSIIWWMLTTYHRRKRDLPRLFASRQFAHLKIIPVRTAAEERRVLDTWRRAAAD